MSEKENTPLQPDLEEIDDGGEDGVVDLIGPGSRLDYSHFRSLQPALGDTKKKKKKPEQSEPPRIGLSKLFPSGIYPEGEIQPYKDECATFALPKTTPLIFLESFSNTWRTTSEEMRYNERMASEDPEVTYQNIRRAAEVHRQVRKFARQYITPGMSMTHIAESIEDGTRALVEENGLESGVGFPTGLSLNHCAAHYTPNAGDTTSVFCHLPLRIAGLPTTVLFLVLQQGDVLKVDFGVHVKGRILDSAFTLNFEPTYDKLIEAVKAATNTGVRVGADILGSYPIFH